MVRWQRLTQAPAPEPSTARARWRGIKYLGEGIKNRTLFYPFAALAAHNAGAQSRTRKVFL
jgi:hypothetical protein